MFEFLNPFRRYQERKRVKLIVEKAMADRAAERAEAEREAKRRKEYADHLDELRRAVKQPRVHSILKPVRESGYQSAYSDADSVTGLLNAISEQSRVTAFEMGTVDIPSSDSPACPSDSSSSTDSNSCGSTD